MFAPLVVCQPRTVVSCSRLSLGSRWRTEVKTVLRVSCSLSLVLSTASSVSSDHWAGLLQHYNSQFKILILNMLSPLVSAINTSPQVNQKPDVIYVPLTSTVESLA